MIRKSLQDIAHMLRNKPYPKPLPAEVARLHCYVIDGGHCILAIPECFEQDAAGDPQAYEVPLAAKYVLEKGWRQMPGTDSIIVDVPYDSMFGAEVPDGYEEW